MESEVVSLIIFFTLLILVPSLLPLRLKMRETMMRRLALEFGLEFHFEPPKLADFYTKLLCLYPDWKVNHVTGKLNGHAIHLCDVLFPGPKILFTALNYDYAYTQIEIDNQCLKG